MMSVTFFQMVYLNTGSHNKAGKMLTCVQSRPQINKESFYTSFTLYNGGGKGDSNKTAYLTRVRISQQPRNACLCVGSDLTG